MTDWYGLYKEGWREEIVKDAYAHPAKYARGLIRKIYDHAIEQDYLQAGGVVLDPFGGVALGALDAMRHGCRWVGVELEQKFVNMGNQNLERWEHYFLTWPDTWGSAVLLQGDSRGLAHLVQSAGIVVSSPPYAKSQQSKDGEFTLESTKGNPSPRRLDTRSYFPAETDTPGQLANMVVSSPPFGAGETRDRSPVQDGEVADAMTRSYTQDNQGSTPGNLASMDAVVSSPPYAKSLSSKGHGIDWSKTGPSSGTRSRGEDTQHGKTLRDKLAYSDDPGNLGNMADGIVTSPPYQTGGHHNHQLDAHNTNSRGQPGPQMSGYADESPAQLGGHGDTFWSAGRQIVDQCYMVLKPGGYAIWVVKRFVRKKEIVDFPGQWEAMCQAAGFESVERIRAWVVENHGTQTGLWGNDQEQVKGHKSFFRRLYEKKYPENAIDWEDVIVMRKGGDSCKV